MLDEQDDLVAAVAEATEGIPAVEATIDLILAKLDEAIASKDMTRVVAATENVRQIKSELARLAVKGTPADPEV